MSDATVALGGTDIWGLTTTAGFHAQSSTTDAYSSEELVLSAIGNKSCTNEHNKGSNYSVTYKYCGITLRSNIGTFATTFGKVVGTGSAAKVMTGMTLNFPGPGQQTEVTIVGHSHQTNNHSATTNPPNTFNVLALIPAATGLGIPSLITVAGESATASRMSASLDFSMNHIDKEANSGHFVGESITCRADLSVDYEGVAGTITAGSWLQILATAADAAEDTDTSGITAHQFIDAI